MHSWESDTNLPKAPERGRELRQQRSASEFPSTLTTSESESSWNPRSFLQRAVERARSPPTGSPPGARERPRSRSVERRSRSEGEARGDAAQAQRRRSTRSMSSVAERYRQSGMDSAQAHRRRSLRSSSGTISDWVRSATFREQDRADIRQRRDSEPRTPDARLSPRPSLDSWGTPRRSFSTESVIQALEQAEQVETEDAVGLRSAGDPSAGMDRHRCELSPDEAETPYPPLPPHPTCAQGCRRRLLPFIMLNARHPYTHRMMHSLAIVRAEQSRQARSRHWYMIHPFSMARMVWEPLVAFLVALSLIIIPVYLAFFMDTRRKSPEDVFAVSLMMSRCQVAATVACMVDCMLNFLTGYYVAHESTTALHPRLVARRYLRSNFFFDFISSLPTELIAKILPKEDTWNIVVCMELLRLTRIRVLLVYTRRTLDLLGAPPLAFPIARATLIFVIFVQWMALAHWFLPPTVYGSELPTSAPGNMTWSVVNDLWNASIGLKYAQCVLRCVTLSLRFGVPLSAPHTTVDRTLCIFNALTGAILYASLFIWLLMLTMGCSSHYIRYEQIMKMLHEYADYKHLSPDLKGKLILYYDYTLERKYFRSNIIEDNLSRHLLNQVQQHSYRESIRSSGLFSGLPRSVCTTLVTYVTPQVLMRGDVLLREGDEPRAMYFVHSGALALLTAKGVEIEHVQDGDHFGEIEMLYPRMACPMTAVVLETTVVLTLERHHFQRVFHSYLPLIFRLQQRAELRMEQLKAADTYSPPPEGAVRDPPRANSLNLANLLRR